MSEWKVDPIHYAWRRCNQGISLPPVLARSVYRESSALRLSEQGYAAKVDAVEAAVRPEKIRHRRPRPAQ
jgi:hypothetical protein